MCNRNFNMSWIAEYDVHRRLAALQLWGRGPGVFPRSVFKDVWALAGPEQDTRVRYAALTAIFVGHWAISPEEREWLKTSIDELISQERDDSVRALAVIVLSAIRHGGIADRDDSVLEEIKVASKLLLA